MIQTVFSRGLSLNSFMLVLVLRCIPIITNKKSYNFIFAGMPPPYPERNFINHESTSESQTLLLPRQNRRNSISSIDSVSGTRFDETELKIGSAAFFAVAAGILFTGCRLLMQNVGMNAIEVTLVGSLVQVIRSMCLELQFSRPRWRWVSATTIASDRYV